MTNELQTAISRGPCPSLPQLAGRYLEEYLAKIRASVERLDEGQVWWRPRSDANSVGNLLLHLRGNLSLWILHGLGGDEVHRQRSAEFAADRSQSKAELIDGLERAVDACLEVLAEVDEEALATHLSLQTYSTDRLGALFHAVEHMAYHTGQIVWIVKELDRSAERLEFYPQHAGE